ncbi:MAG TPA: hypothetical protein VFH17_01835 [Coriobacteriia bacterium]|nr:hypothetical protein [Coriobacteriia bacterium]
MDTVGPAIRLLYVIVALGFSLAACAAPAPTGVDTATKTADAVFEEPRTITTTATIGDLMIEMTAPSVIEEGQVGEFALRLVNSSSGDMPLRLGDYSIVMTGLDVRVASVLEPEAPLEETTVLRAGESVELTYAAQFTPGVHSAMPSFSGGWVSMTSAAATVTVK